MLIAKCILDRQNCSLGQFGAKASHVLPPCRGCQGILNSGLVFSILCILCWLGFGSNATRGYYHRKHLLVQLEACFVTVQTYLALVLD